MAIEVEFGEQVREALRGRGVSMRAFAGVLGVSVSYLSDVVNGKKRPSASLAAGVQHELGVVWVAPVKVVGGARPKRARKKCVRSGVPSRLAMENDRLRAEIEALKGYVGSGGVVCSPNGEQALPPGVIGKVRTGRGEEVSSLGVGGHSRPVGVGKKGKPANARVAEDWGSCADPDFAEGQDFALAVPEASKDALGQFVAEDRLVFARDGWKCRGVNQIHHAQRLAIYFVDRDPGNRTAGNMVTLCSQCCEMANSIPVEEVMPVWGVLKCV